MILFTLQRKIRMRKMMTKKCYQTEEVKAEEEGGVQQQLLYRHQQMFKQQRLMDSET